MPLGAAKAALFGAAGSGGDLALMATIIIPFVCII